MQKMAKELEPSLSRVPRKYKLWEEKMFCSKEVWGVKENKLCLDIDFIPTMSSIICLCAERFIIGAIDSICM